MVGEEEAGIRGAVGVRSAPELDAALETAKVIGTTTGPLSDVGKAPRLGVAGVAVASTVVDFSFTAVEPTPSAALSEWGSGVPKEEPGVGINPAEDLTRPPLLGKLKL